MNGRKLTKKQQVQLGVILTVLFWATTLLLHQWGFGQETTPLTISPDEISSDKFVTDPNEMIGGTLELRGEATIIGSQAKLKQVCRWSAADATVFKSLENLTVARMDDKTAFKSVTVADIRQMLHDAGVNVAMINFAGAESCTITRADASIDPRQALEDWIDSRQSGRSPLDDADSPATQPDVAPPPVAAPTADAQPAHRLQALLIADACQRLGVSPDDMQITFNPEDEKILALSEPYFKFNIQPQRMNNLGAVSWDVTIVTDTGDKDVTISAIARAWEQQVIVAKPIAYKQVLQESDFTSSRILANVLPDQPLLRLDQCVGQQAASDMKPGTIMVPRLVDPVPMVRGGQLVTVMLQEGSVQIKTVGRALEPGSMGQTIKVRNDATRDVFDVTITGQQEGRLTGTD
jgi:flagella basal body P-ring formation protein FlgA